jgi:uncharacterized membrane protein YcaP (DUF421 family)
MGASWQTLLQIALRSSVVYLVVIVGIRLSGKREVGQMTPFDLTLLLLLSNSVQNAMTGPDTSLAGGIVAATTLLLFNFAIGKLSGTNRVFRKFIEGSPTLLVHNGQVIADHMRRERVSMDELKRAMREHNIDHVEDIALAVLEVDGTISCLRHDDVKQGGPEHAHVKRIKFLRKH